MIARLRWMNSLPATPIFITPTTTIIPLLPALRYFYPSPVSWSAEYCALVKYIVTTFEQALQQIELSRALTAQEKRLLHLGICNVDSHERLSPLHPLVLAYHFTTGTNYLRRAGTIRLSVICHTTDHYVDRLVVSGDAIRLPQ